MSGIARALQVCPGDHPPFLDLCKSHAAALAKIGMTVDTVYLGAPQGMRWEGAAYLGIERGTRRMIDALRGYCAGRTYQLVLAHRYRAYQVATRIRHVSDAATTVVVAHEFGMFARRRRRWRQQLFARDVHFAGVSQAVVDEMRLHHPRLLHTLVLPNPADVERLDRVRLSRDEARSRLGIPQRAHVVGMVGRLHPEKRPLLALQAFASANLPADARLVFVGDGSLRGVLESSAASLGVASRVHFTGYVADAAQYLSAFDELLFASGPTEAFGMVLLEAMFARVPIICADMPGPRSVLGPDGLYFAGDETADVAAALQRGTNLSEAARVQLCGAQRLRAEQEFSLAAVADLFAQLLSTDATRRAAAS